MNNAGQQNASSCSRGMRAFAVQPSTRLVQVMQRVESKGSKTSNFVSLGIVQYLRLRMG